LEWTKNQTLQCHDVRNVEMFRTQCQEMIARSNDGQQLSKELLTNIFKKRLDDWSQDVDF